MDWILALSLTTFAILIAFLLWNRISTKRRQELGRNATGIGGPSDPLAGNTPGIRPAAALRAGLDAASDKEA